MNHPEASTKFHQNPERVKWHDQSLWFIRNKRDLAVKPIDEWEELRETAKQLKDNVLSNLDTYLEQFEANATKNGIKVHWAADAAEHNQIVFDLLKERKIKRLVKSKSMLTEECKLNPFLIENGIDVIDTDLGERIIQLLKEPPSHIVLPAIHLKKEEIGRLFHEKLGTEKGATDPVYLTNAARNHLRSMFLEAEASLSGVNFGIAETGSFVVCTNEGNSDMGNHLSNIHIASMGIEKIIPRWQDLGVFLRLLARSATGQPITIYSSHYRRPRPESELHLVIVDNGRSKHLGMEDFRTALRCIRCGACMNTCPVYRRSGGQSYGYTIPGPIGSILTPNIDMKKFWSLPFASTLCGSCSDVCPVKIDIHDQLYKWRQKIVEEGYAPASKRWIARMLQMIFESPARYRWSGKMGRKLLGMIPRTLLYNSRNTWGQSREMPAPPRQSFRDWYVKSRKK